MNLANFISRFPGRSKSSGLQIPHTTLSDDGKFNWDNCNPKTNGEYFLIDQCARHWRNCFDIGANEGEYAAHVLEQNPDCSVVCFEPNVLLHDALNKKNVSDICPVAVGDLCGTVEMNFDLLDSTQSSMHRRHGQCRTKDVPVVTVDACMAERGIGHLSFMKIDTEGHEVAVLRGAAVSIKNQCIGMIQFEYGGTFYDAGTTLRQAYEMLQDNYLICHLFPQGMVPIPYSERLETFRYSNWVAVSRNIFSNTAGWP